MTKVNHLPDFEHQKITHSDSKAHGANMGPIWVRQDPGGLHVGPMNWLSNVSHGVFFGIIL